jgi:hypothetical protein
LDGVLRALQTSVGAFKLGGFIVWAGVLNANHGAAGGIYDTNKRWNTDISQILTYGSAEVLNE